MAVQPPKIANIDVDIPLEDFGGLCTEITSGDLPMGASPFCQDVDFQLGGVYTRAGLTAVVSGISTSPNCNYLKTFGLPNTNLETLLLFADGTFRVEDVTNAPGLFPTVATLSRDQFANSVTQFGREWLAFSDGVWGFDAPRQWDSTFLDRVSQDGPGIPPAASDEAIAFGIVAGPAGAVMVIPQVIPAGPNGVSEVGNIVTVNQGALPGAKVGDSVIIAGVGVVGYNGTFKIASIDTSLLTQSFTYFNPTSGLAASGGGTADFQQANITTTAANGFVLGQLVTIAGVGVGGYNGTYTIREIIGAAAFRIYLGAVLAASGGGTATPIGTITAGIHKLVQIFLTREGYLTSPSPIGQWTSAGTTRVVVSNLAVGPSNVIARWVAFTSAGGGFFFVIPTPTTGSTTGTVVLDNTSRTATFDFSDITLLNSFSIDSAGNNLFNLVVLGPSAGVISYSNRMIFWGERNKIQNFRSMGFDGGFDPTNTYPLGWTLPATSAGGGAKGSVPSFPNDTYQITFGGNPVLDYGQIQQPAYQDSFGVAILQPNTAYSVRLEAIRTGAGPTGNLIVDFFSATSGVLATATIPQTSIVALTGAWVSAAFSAATPAVIPSDTVLRIYVLGTTIGGTNNLDEVEIFPTNQPFISTTLRASYNSNPESFDGVTGRIGISNFDGQAIKACFKLRDNLYVVKEGSLYVTQDNGQTEPFGWTVSTISDTIGTCSIRGIAVAEEYVFLVNQMGVYMFNGSEPVRVNQEIKPVSPLGQGWDTVNWRFGSTIWVALDINNRHLLIGAPTGEHNRPNQIFMMNYRDLDDSYSVASQKPVHVSYSGKMVAWDMSRKWTMWNIPANCCAIVRRQDLSLQVWFGNNSSSGKAYQLDSTATTDDGAAILSSYYTFFFVNREMEQGLQVGSGRHLYTYLRTFTSGAGVLSLTAIADSLTSTRVLPLAARTLSANPLYDIELGVNFTGDRVAFKYATDGQAGSNFQLNKHVTSMRPDPWMPIRGRV